MKTALTRAIQTLPVVFALAALSPTGVQADSFTSSAASAASNSVASLSDSVGTSSKSSSGGPKLAEGLYRVTHIAELTDKPGHLRLTLHAHHEDQREAAPKAVDASFTLDLPRALLGERATAVGDLIDVRHRPYGLAFARAVDAETARAPTARREVFFLALDDAWRQDLDPVLVKS